MNNPSTTQTPHPNRCQLLWHKLLDRISDFQWEVRRYRDAFLPIRPRVWQIYHHYCNGARFFPAYRSAFRELSLD